MLEGLRGTTEIRISASGRLCLICLEDIGHRHMAAIYCEECSTEVNEVFRKNILIQRRKYLDCQSCGTSLIPFKRHEKYCKPCSGINLAYHEIMHCLRKNKRFHWIAEDFDNQEFLDVCSSGVTVMPKNWGLNQLQ